MLVKFVHRADDNEENMFICHYEIDCGQLDSLFLLLLFFFFSPYLTWTNLAAEQYPGPVRKYHECLDLTQIRPSAWWNGSKGQFHQRYKYV